jgi:quercetin dioxygenase-like cupin family protein
MNLSGNTMNNIQMRKMIKWVMAVSAIAIISCNHSNDQGVSDLYDSKEDLIFPKGEKIENGHFDGIAWLQTLVESDSTHHIAVGTVTFEPGSRTNWHLHPDGQILLALGGEGYYQEQGSPKKILRKGDVVKCPPNVPHWHSSSSDKAFIQIAITSRLKGHTEWIHAVSEEEYHASEM